MVTNLEVSAAIRDENFSTGQSDAVTQFGITYRPTDWLTLHATDGFDLTLCEDLTFSLTWSETDFKDRIVSGYRA